MFVAWRELRFARGRFLLIGSVVALITLLVGFLGGLTFGLANANISALTSLTADRVVFAAPDNTDVSYGTSAVTAEQDAEWGSDDDVHVAPLGILTTRATGPSSGTAAVTIFGVDDGFAALAGGQGLPAAAGTIVLSEPAASTLGAAVGDTVGLGGKSFTVKAVSGNSEYSHTPVVYALLSDWQVMAQQQTGAAEAPFATVLLAQGGSDATMASLDDRAGTTSEGVVVSLLSLESFKSEIGSLGMMMAMLFGISALVIGAFFTVWTLQRVGDIAVLKALGASTRSVMLDSLGQALIVLAAGVGVGLLLTIGLGLLASGALPFVLSPLTTLLPAGIMVLLGMAGAAFALRNVTTVDPITALNGRNS